MSKEIYDGCIINNGKARDMILYANEGNSEGVDLKKFSELLDTVNLLLKLSTLRTGRKRESSENSLRQT